MQTSATPELTTLHFQHLPAFAAYVLNERLRDFSVYQLQITRQLQVPVLRHIAHLPEEELIQLGMQTSSELLGYLVRNEARRQIEYSVQRWISNSLPRIDKYEIEAEDITLINLVRKRALMHLAPQYTQDVELIVALAMEIDLYTTASVTASTNTYINLLKDRIDEHSHFIQKINNTTPGAIYVFDNINYKGIYANGKLKDVFGYDHDYLNRLGTEAIQKLVHPDDKEALINHAAAIDKARDGEICSYRFRVKIGEDQYRWVRSYESVFKRTEDGSVAQIIGIALDVDREKKVAEQLQQREKELLEAQDIAQLGSFVWDIASKSFQGTPKMYQLLELESNNLAPFFEKLQPAELQQLKTEYEKALATGLFETEFRYNSQKGTKIFWSKAVVDYADGSPVTLSGTMMDITERSAILDNMRQNEERFKQAEALTHIGNYELDIVKHQVVMSAEMYRIFDLTPQENEWLDYKTIISLRHPDDRTLVDAELKAAMAAKGSYNFYYRIITRAGVLKILRARGEVIVNETGQPVKLIGTIQDVTEKQQLIEKLKNSEHMYKQAEALANMGNYTMNVVTEEIEWTDQLYTIYELEPQSEKITLDRFFAFIHPDDRALVEQDIATFYITGSADYTFRIITASGTVKTLRSIAQLQRDEAGKPIFVIGTEQDITEHRNLVSKLERSQALHKQAQAIARLGNWSYNLQTGETIWSEELYRIYELPPDTKVSYELFLSYIHPDDKDSVLESYQYSLQHKTPFTKRHRIVLANGKIKTLQRKGEMIFDNDGTVLELYGTTQDVTEQQAVENELRDKQNFIQKIADATPSIIASYNVNTGQYVFINEGIRKLLGYDPQEVMQKGAPFVLDLVHPDDRDALIEKNTTALGDYNRAEKKDDDNLIVEFTYRMRHRNGTYRWFQTYGTIFDRNPAGTIEHVLNISLDITDRIAATEKIKEQEHFINHIADASPTILYLYRAAENRIAYINREVYYVLGYTTDEIIAAGDGITRLLYHPEDYPLLPERGESNKRFSHHSSMMQYECRVKNKAGNWCWLLVREVIFKSDDDGNVVEILGAALDITRRKEMEKTLLQNSFQLEQSNASLEEFAYVASHDLKEPLRKISTFGDRLITTQLDKLTDDGKTYLKKIVDASQRMQTMINDLLSISMITGNRSFEPCSLQAILDEVLQTLEYKIEQRGAIIHADPLPEANIIPSQFRQLFQNLLSNSLKFVRDNVQPEIYIRHRYIDADSAAPLQLTKAKQYLQLEFADNGIGFEEEYAGKIFAIFQRLHGRSEYEGTGIGLAICKKIVEHHGGAIYAAGTPNKGATFTIILPV